MRQAGKNVEKILATVGSERLNASAEALIVCVGDAHRTSYRDFSAGKARDRPSFPRISCAEMLWKCAGYAVE